MVDNDHTLRPEDRALWEVPLPAGVEVTIDLTARSAFGYSVELVNHSLSDSVYYNAGDDTELRGRQAQAILPGNRNVETPGVSGSRFTFVCATDARLSVVRA
jgi:chaperone required for assembly of F1-ATPase